MAVTSIFPSNSGAFYRQEKVDSFDIFVSDSINQSIKNKVSK